ncbi:MAG: PTS sugar transporter subunit IIA [Treponema sp.]|jgi:mannitol/fructose-specific phosphotransferase system IIA component (Ntr-type)|nr:PTS sugar transporter subunit IIA [Treponema sp.]
MLLSDIFDKQAIKPNLESTTRDEVFSELVQAVTAVHPALDRDISLRAIQERENKLNTSVAPGVAVPHGYYPGTDGIFGAFGFSKSGIAYGALDEKPVHCVFLIIMGDAPREKHLRVLNRIMSLINSGGLELLRNAGGPDEMHRIFSRFH